MASTVIFHPKHLSIFLRTEPVETESPDARRRIELREMAREVTRRRQERRCDRDKERRIREEERREKEKREEQEARR